MNEYDIKPVVETLINNFYEEYLSINKLDPDKEQKLKDLHDKIFEIALKNDDLYCKVVLHELSKCMLLVMAHDKNDKDFNKYASDLFADIRDAVKLRKNKKI